ncbi:MAG: cytochrome c3 family protein [Acidobacteria bacterium]|nr:cytochrome c3 family protein [Acidobacteriota bacterium]
MAAPRDCAPCHAERVRAQAATAHAQALRPYAGEHFNGRTLREQGGAEYSYRGNQVLVTRAGESAEFLIRWAFGSGVQAVTPVLERGGRWIEHRVTWYREGNRLGLTPGHAITPGPEIVDSLGIVQTERNVQRCFGCHTTGGEPGVTCQSCHGDGAGHRKAPAPGNIRRDRSVALCAQCHRSPDAVYASAAPEMEDPRSIRFAPVGFQASRCFQKSNGFTCVSCHDPHAENATPSVTPVCRGCHAEANSPCPRTQDCAGCHMKASSPAPRLRFTDHRIR